MISLDSTCIIPLDDIVISWRDLTWLYLNFLQVPSHAPIFIQINSANDNQLLKFITEECYATPTPDPQSSTRYLFMDDRCALDTTFKRYQENVKNSFSFSIDAFTFIKVKKQVFFHCRLVVCKVGWTTKGCMSNRVCAFFLDTQKNDAILFLSDLRNSFSIFICYNPVRR